RLTCFLTAASEDVPTGTDRHKSYARIPYSVTCAILRMANCIALSVSIEISGFSQRRNGTRKCEVCSADMRSVEPTKISTIHKITGSQYLKKERVVIG